MMQSALLEFDSEAFPPRPGEDELTNPGIFGESLANWLKSELADAGITVGEVIPEDFGWCIAVETKPHSVYVACASYDAPPHWQVHAFAEGGLLNRLLGKDRRAESLATVFAVVRKCLESSPKIRGLREVPA